MSYDANKAINLGRLATYDGLMKDYISDEMSDVVRYEEFESDGSTDDIILPSNVSEIDDNTTSTGTTWSSEKINALIQDISNDADSIAKIDWVSGVDVLTTTREGIFYSVNTINVPTTYNSGYLRVIPSMADINAYRTIIWIPADNNEIYVNVMSEGTWSGWKQLATTDKVLPLDGSMAMTGRLNMNTSNPKITLTDPTLKRKGAMQVNELGETWFGSGLIEENRGVSLVLNPDELTAEINTHDNGKDHNYAILHTGNYTDYVLPKTGNVVLESHSTPTVALLNTTASAKAAVVVTDEGTTELRHGAVDDDSNYATLVLNRETSELANALLLNRVVNDEVSTYKIYGEHNKPTAEDLGITSTGDATVAEINLEAHKSNKSNPHGVTAEQVGALPTTGGEVTGDLTVNRGTSFGSMVVQRTAADGSIGKNYLSVALDGTTPVSQMMVTKDGVQCGAITVGGDNYFKYKDITNSKSYDVIHTGNKNLISAADVGALPITGGTLTGNTSIAKTNPVMIITDTADNGGATRIGNSEKATYIHSLDVAGDVTNRRQITICPASKESDIANAVRLIEVSGGKVIANHQLIHTGNKNLISPSDIGALKVYTNITDLGLTEADATAEQIALVMSDNSMLLHNASDTASSSALGLPVNWGLLRVIKRHSSYVEFDYISGSATWSAYYNHGSSGTKWFGWVKTATTDYAVNKAGDIMTGSLTVKRAWGNVAIEDPNLGRKAILEMNSNHGGFTLYTYADTKNQARLTLNPETTDISHILYLTTKVDDVEKGYDVIHSGNYSNYAFPITGGTVSGHVFTSNGDPVFGTASGSTATRLRVYSGPGAAYNDGAGIILNNKNATTDPGMFQICANNGTASSVLKGKSDGGLFWRGVNVLRGDPTTTDPGVGSTLATGQVCLVYEP